MKYPIRVSPAGLFLFSVFFLTPILAYGQEPARGGPVYCSYPSEPKNFNPDVRSQDASEFFSTLLFNALIKFNDRMEAVPDLAQSWETSPDGLEWKFHLRRNVLFHDGTELTASDVVETYKRFFGKRENLPSPAFERILKGYAAADRYTFVISLAEPYGPLLNLLGQSILPARLLQDERYMANDFNEHPIGTGPFRFEKRVPGEITFTVFDGYFEGKPRLGSVVFRLNPDNKKAWVSLMQGNLDVVRSLDYQEYAVTSRDPRFKTYQSAEPLCYSLLFNLKDPLLSQKEIRQAIAYAVDRDDIVEKSLSIGGGIAATGPFIPGNWPYNPNPSIQRFDLQRSREILAGLGWKDTDMDWILEKGNEKLAITILIDQGDAVKETAAKRLQWQLLQSGIRVDIEVVPLNEFLSKRVLPGKFQAILIQLNSAGDPDIAMSAFWHSSSIGALNISSYKNAEVDGLIEEGRRTSDQTKRTEIYRKLHKLIADDAPAVFLFYKSRFSAISVRIGGINPNANLLKLTPSSQWYIISQNGTNGG
jgi:peptide/nickel transport system substrate-binding protein